MNNSLIGAKLSQTLLFLSGFCVLAANLSKNIFTMVGSAVLGPSLNEAWLFLSVLFRKRLVSSLKKKSPFSGHDSLASLIAR
jgi:hypothetical protein